MSKHWNPPQNEARERMGAAFEGLHVGTKVLKSHLPPSGSDVDPVAVPIFQTSVYRNTSVQQYLDILNDKGYIYQRLGNPTTETAELLINELEGGKGTILYNSGLAAMSSVFLCFLHQGDHLICQNPCYSGTQEFVNKTLKKFGVEVSWLKAGDSMDECRKLIRPNTKMIYTETPCNPNMAIMDLEGLGRIGAENPSIMTVVDGTFGSPYLQQPIKLGVDVSIHSCSKYMGGHTDLIGGCATLRDVAHWKALKVYQASSGTAMSPFDAYLLIRGLKTLHVRMVQHCRNAETVAKFLEAHPKVVRVWYPGLPSHPQHSAAAAQMKMFGGMISFEMGSLESARRVVESVQVINLAVSLGGTESLIEHPASMTHGPMLMSEEERRQGNITDGLIRFSVGLEDAQDLIDDLAQALAKA